MNRPGHGPDDFEERLRTALRRRADEVAPDPHLWTRVKERAASRRRTRWLGAAATVTPLLAAVAVSVALGLPDRDAGIDMADVGPVATATSAVPTTAPEAPAELPPPPTTTDAPPPEPEETATAPALPEVVPSGGAPEDRVLVLATTPGLVVSDASARAVDVVVVEPASQPGECADREGCEAEVLSDLHARPGSSATDLAVTFLESFEPCLGQAGYALRSYGTAPSTDAVAIDLPDDPCPAAPVWSPDGTRLAWLERAAGGGLDLVTVPFPDEPADASTPALQARAAIPGDLVPGLDEPRIVEWAADAEADAAVLYVTGDAVGEERGLFRLPVATGGAVVEPSGPLVAVQASDDRSRYLTYASAGELGSAYLIDRVQPAQDGGPTLELVLSAAGDGSEAAPPAPVLELPPELVDPVAPLGERVWLRARGAEVLFGDGVDQAWRVRWDGAAWTPMEVLPGAIRSADFLDPAGS